MHDTFEETINQSCRMYHVWNIDHTFQFEGG